MPTRSPHDAASRPAAARPRSVPRRIAAAASNAGVKSAANSAAAEFFGYTFRDPTLLALALTHSSLAYETHRDPAADPGDNARSPRDNALSPGDNERLEFIGDAVLGLLVAEALYRQFPALREGELTRMRATLVSRRNLAEVADRIALGPMLRLGRGEQHSGGQHKPALLADALEAVLAALYLDGGLTPAAVFVQRFVLDPAQPMLHHLLDSAVPFAGAVGDYKSALQERLQATGAGQPHYLLTEESGPDHQKRFRIQVRIDAPDGSSTPLAEAEGTTKKQAQQEAARLAFASLDSAADKTAAADKHREPAP